MFRDSFYRRQSSSCNINTTVLFLTVGIGQVKGFLKISWHYDFVDFTRNGFRTCFFYLNFLKRLSSQQQQISATCMVKTESLRKPRKDLSTFYAYLLNKQIKHNQNAFQTCLQQLSWAVSLFIKRGGSIAWRSIQRFCLPRFHRRSQLRTQGLLSC